MKKLLNILSTIFLFLSIPTFLCGLAVFHQNILILLLDESLTLDVDNQQLIEVPDRI